MKLGLICDGEPGLGACQKLGLELQRLGAIVTLISKDQPPPIPTDGEPLLSWLPLSPLAAAADRSLLQLDAVGVFLEGPALQNFRHIHRDAAQMHGSQPAGLFTGPIRPLCGDALIADLLHRLNYDLICIQGEAQREQLLWLQRGCGHPDQEHEMIGLWCLNTEPVYHSTSQNPVLLVIDQHQVPPSPFANSVLYQRLRSIALENLDWCVRLQPESPVPSNLESFSDTSLVWHALQDPQRPTNLQVGEAEDLPLALMQATACVGIGSSWLITAMVWGKPTAVLGDYGIRTDFNGPLFFGSGCMRRLADCVPLERMKTLEPVNPQWLGAQGWSIADGPARLLRRLEHWRR